MTITVTISNFSFPALRRDGAFVPHLCFVRNRRLWFCLKRCFRALRGSLDWEQVYCTKEYRRENGEVQKSASQDTSEQKQLQNETKRFQNCCPIRLIQLSAVGEVFLEGTCPLSRRPQTAKFPAPCFWRTEQVGEKSDSFSRAERTRPLRPVCRLLYCDLENVPVERFQRVLSCFKRKRTRHAVSLRIYTNSKMFHVKQKAPLRCFT